MGRFTDFTDLFCLCKKKGPIKLKPHSRITLAFCIFPKQLAGLFCNFPKQNTLYSYIFSKILCRGTFSMGTPLYDKKVLQSCGIYQKIIHSALLRAYYPDSPQILYEVFTASNQIWSSRSEYSRTIRFIDLE